MDKKLKIKKFDYLLIIGLILAPMTGLRITKVGPGELLCFIWCFKYLKEYLYLKINNFFIAFWLLFILSIVLGTCYGIYYHPDQVRIGQLGTWLYLMIISLGIYIGLNKKNLVYIEYLLERICIISTFWYAFLYLFSIYVSKIFLGAPLWFANIRFTGGAKNPHQLAVMMSSIIFICYRLIVKNNAILSKRATYIVCILICTFIAFETQSSTLVMSVLITSIIGVFLIVINLAKREKKYIFSCILICSISIVGLLFFNYFFEKIFNWISSDPNGIGRLEIFSSIIDTLEKSPIIGLGPGVHGKYGTIEYHNTYLEILAMTGIVGVIIFVFFSVKAFNIIKTDKLLVLIILPLYLYGLAGFAMRRLIYWGIFVFILVIGKKLKNQTKRI